jgi:2-dehydropantoate 2-reductase
MLSAIERGREPSVDFLNGEVIDRGRRHGLRVRTNEHVHRMVWDIAQKRRVASMDTLRALYDETGPHGA